MVKLVVSSHGIGGGVVVVVGKSVVVVEVDVVVEHLKSQKQSL
jgi:hypothetical protein